MVGIAGGSCAGKSTLTRRVAEYLLPLESNRITGDRYYRPLDHLAPAERCRQNFDSPDMIDLPLLEKQLAALKNGEAVELPVYDYRVHTRADRTERIDPAPVVLVEGLLVLAIPRIYPLFDLKVYIETPDEVRLSRRIRRDRETRGRTVESVLRQYLETVLPAHRKLVRPSRDRADMVVKGEGTIDAAAAAVAEKIRKGAGGGGEA